MLVDCGHPNLPPLLLAAVVVTVVYRILTPRLLSALIMLLQPVHQPHRGRGQGPFLDRIPGHRRLQPLFGRNSSSSSSRKKRKRTLLWWMSLLLHDDWRGAWQAPLLLYCRLSIPAEFLVGMCLKKDPEVHVNTLWRYTAW